MPSMVSYRVNRLEVNEFGSQNKRKQKYYELFEINLDSLTARRLGHHEEVRESSNNYYKRYFREKSIGNNESSSRH